MKKLFLLLLLVPVLWVMVSSMNSKSVDIFENFKMGDPEIKSMNALAFGPEATLFVGDSKSASVFAIETGDTQAVEMSEALDISNFDQKVASALGTNTENITIQDMAVNPISKKVYIAVHMNDGAPVLLRLSGGDLESVSTKGIRYSDVSINNAPAEDAQDRRGRSLRVWAVSDLGYYDGKVMLSGLSNQEFGSTFRSIPFPFTDKQDHASLEIYHGAHGQYETHSPIKTFTVTELMGKDYLVASYTCTPLVLFPLEDLKSGTHVKGRTVAELGFGNTPLDMITMTKEGKSHLLMSNSNRPLMTVKYENLEKYEGSLTEPIQTTAGVDHFNLPLVNVLQLDKLDEEQFMVLQRRSNGNLHLRSLTVRWL
jgi:hypothetical protein